MEYLLIEIVLFALFAFVHYKYKVKIFDRKSQFWKFWILVFVFGIIWDWFAIWRGHWIYPGPGITGWFFLGPIPLEDLIFMALVPYGILVAYRVSQRKK